MSDEWIKVEDRLPNHMEKIKFKGNFPFECNGFIERTEIGYSFLHNNNEKVFHIYGVTHWMPLPKSPEIKGLYETGLQN